MYYEKCKHTRLILIKMNGGRYMYYVRDKELEDRDVILASCELCIDNIGQLDTDIQLDVLSELHGYLTEKINQLQMRM